MTDSVQPFRHVDAVTKTDEKLREEARAHLARSPHLQVLAEILAKLRALALPWWTAEQLRESFPAVERMHWYAERPDLRQAVTRTLTGLAPRAARARTPASQAELIDAVIDCGDISATVFEAAFDPHDIAVYGAARAIWRRLRESLPWESDARAHQQLVAWILRALISEKSDEGIARKPVLSAWELRTALDSRVWQTRIPADVRIAIDEARLQQERRSPRDPYHARHELEIATPEIIASHVPLRELHRVFVAAERCLGFAEAETEKPVRPPAPPVPRSMRALEMQPTPCTGEILIDDGFFDGVIAAAPPA